MAEKVYLLTYDWAEDDAIDGDHIDMVYAKKEDAIKKMKELIADTEECEHYKRYDVIEKTATSYEAYEDGYYVSEHTVITIEEKEVL